MTDEKRKKKLREQKMDEIWRMLDEVITHVEDEDGCVPKDMEYIYDRVYEARNIVEYIEGNYR